jgi:hypothetical protein
MTFPLDQAADTSASDWLIGLPASIRVTGKHGN